MSAFFTVYQWWWNRHFDSGEPVLSYAHPGSGIKVLPDKEWFDRDFQETNQDCNLSSPFLDQLRQLQLSIPINATRNAIEPENSIATISLGDQNSYFVSACKSKDSYYLINCEDAEECMDCTDSIKITESYHCLVSNRLHRCKYIRDSHDLINCSFMFDCRNCEFCFGASNKRNKKYLWWNEQLSKDEWEKRVAEVDLGDRQVLDQMVVKFDQMINDAVWPENFNEQSENCTGEYLLKCVNCYRAWYSDGAKNCRYVVWDNFTSENNALSISPSSSHSYGNPAIFKSSKCKFCFFGINCQECEYCIDCYDCQDCFGCVGLRRKKYHIFNKEYSEDEYWQKVDQLKCTMLDRGEYGRSLPMKFAYTPFVHSAWHQIFENDNEIKKRINAIDFDASLDGAYGDWEGKEMISIEQLPKRIDEADNSWTGKAIVDPVLKRPFSIHSGELAFLKKKRLPLRRGHFVSWVERLRNSLNKYEQEQRECDQCSKSTTVSKNTTFPNRKIYCRECYLKYLETQT